MHRIRYYHRLVTLAIVVIALFLGITGTIIQVVDLKVLYTKAPATDENLRAIRESFDGPPDFQVRETRDYLAAALPATVSFPGMFRGVLDAARRQLGEVPFGYLELRMRGDKPVGVVGVGGGHASFDAMSGALLERTNSDRPDVAPRDSIRYTFKHLHRMTTFGDWALAINLVVSMGLAVLIVTGIWIYAKLYLARAKARRYGPFWSAGGGWRTLHRAISVVAALLLVVVTLSGAWLAVESAGLGIYFATHDGPGGGPRSAPQPPPLADSEVPAMLGATLEALAGAAPGEPIKVIRIRRYASYPQGVVVTGGEHSRQLVFDTRNGKALSETEPGYPEVGFPFGWQAHQIAKSVHRGDFFGLGGRWLDLLAGLSLVYLSVSAIVMYWDMWRRRVDSGRSGLLWK